MSQSPDVLKAALVHLRLLCCCCCRRNNPVVVVVGQKAETEIKNNF